MSLVSNIKETISLNWAKLLMGEAVLTDYPYFSVIGKDYLNRLFPDFEIYPIEQDEGYSVFCVRLK